MNQKQRLEAVLENRVPDKVPHFELLFQIPEATFGRSWPTPEQVAKASARERDDLKEEYLDICERIVDRYGWSAVHMPNDLHGFYRDDFLREGRRRFGDRALLFDFNGMGTFWMPTGDEIMDFVVKLYEDPKGLHEEAKAKMMASIELARVQVDRGYDFLVINSDYGYNEGPFISPAMFAEFVTPYLTEIVGKMHDFGIKAILHSDGDLRLILDQLCGTGIDGYQSIDPQGHMDIAEVKRIYGDRLILMGNVRTSLLQDVEEEGIRESVRYCMVHGKPDGGFVFSTSNCLFQGMPIESYHIMLDEYEKWAYY